MEIITKDNKDYLKTTILKVDNHLINTELFFSDLKECYAFLLQKHNKETLEEGDYGYNIQGTLNRLSGTYFSPSFMKTFRTNPANVIFNAVAKEEVKDATLLGTTVHKILEAYYLQPKDGRNRTDLLTFIDTYAIEGQDKQAIKRYIEGYIQTQDYLAPDKPLDDKTLDCFCEVRKKDNIYIPKFDIELPLPLSYVVDRVDVRDQGLYILDYKTGNQSIKSATFDGYLDSMILYKWGIEQEFGLPVLGGYLVTPGNADKYIPLDFSLVNESKTVEMVLTFYEQFKKCLDANFFPFTEKGYFTSSDMKMFKGIMGRKTDGEEIEVECYIGEHVE